jgi:hypothetical protein
VISPATGGGEWRGEYDRVSKRDRLGLTPDLTTRDLWRSRRWARRNDNFVYLSLWDFKSSFTCRKMLQHGTFPLYFPSKKVCCGFLSPIKNHRLCRVFNPQHLGPMASTLTTTPPMWPHSLLMVFITTTGLLLNQLPTPVIPATTTNWTETWVGPRV